MAQLELGVEVADKRHMLLRACLLNHMHPVVYRLAVFLLDGWKEGSWAFSVS